MTKYYKLYVGKITFINIVLMSKGASILNLEAIDQ